jgi:2-desacetyl-2-hydroxyethyl bacteriochlorophyllide A dehydrogenase
MGQVLIFQRPGQIAFEAEEERRLLPAEVRVQTLYSGISAGTELTAYRGSNPYLHKQWDERRRLFVPERESTLNYPLRGWGYEEVGEIVEVGPEVSGLPLGARVYGTWGHRTHHILPAAYAMDRLMPGDLEPILGIFSHLGSIALNGIHDGQIRLGETVAVFGLGSLGQIVAQAARQSGAMVVGIDLYEQRRKLAQRLGTPLTIDPAAEKAAEVIKELTGGRGADVCFEVTGSTRALHEAVRAAAYSARVVALGFFQGEASGLYLGEEFHHNRINLVCSQISGVAPELNYRWDRLRLAQTAIRLQAEGKLNLRPLITHVETFADAARLFETLDERAEQVVQCVLQFDPPSLAS